MAIRVGCGSWADDEYVGVLYPPKLAAKERLGAYARIFDHVEVNSSYYRTPQRAAVLRWVKETPEGFLFDLKLHRVFSMSPARAEVVPEEVVVKTSAKRAKVDAEVRKDLLAYMLEQIEPLIAANKLGTFLLVLAPTFTPEKHVLKELDALVERLQPHTLAVELRHTDWIKGKARGATFEWFRERGVAWVDVDMPQLKSTALMPPLDEVTQPRLAYLRLHGRNPKYLEGKSAAEKHTYLYSEADLKEIVSRIRKLAKGATEVRVVANNHAEDFAPRTALQLKKMLAEK